MFGGLSEVAGFESDINLCLSNAILEILDNFHLKRGER